MFDGRTGPADPKKAAAEVLREVRRGCRLASMEVLLNILIDENFVDSVGLNKELERRGLRYDLVGSDETILTALELALENAEDDHHLVELLVRRAQASTAATTAAKAALKSAPDEPIDAVPVDKDDPVARFREQSSDIQKMRLAEIEEAARPKPTRWARIKNIFTRKPKPAATAEETADFPPDSQPRPTRKTFREHIGAIGAAAKASWKDRGGLLRYAVYLVVFLAIFVIGFTAMNRWAAKKSASPATPVAPAAVQLGTPMDCVARVVIVQGANELETSIVGFEGMQCPQGIAYLEKSGAVKVFTTSAGGKLGVDESRVDWTIVDQSLPVIAMK